MDPVRVPKLQIAGRETVLGCESHDRDEIDNYLAAQTTCLADLVAAGVIAIASAHRGATERTGATAGSGDAARAIELIARSVVSAISESSLDVR
jgi:3,4-dihydroxy-2-butanone 4-phosphate synthase